MNTLTIQETKEFARHRADFCVTLTMPTNPAGVDARKDFLRLRNLLHQAETVLLERGARPADVQQMLAPAEEFAAAGSISRRHQNGLALLIAPTMFRPLSLVKRQEEYLYIGRRFHLTPIIAALQSDPGFMLLALSQKEIRLFKGDANTIQEIPLDKSRFTFLERMGETAPEKQVQHHSLPRVSGNLGGQAIFHGSPPDDLDEKENLARFFRKADSELRDLLDREQRPLLLAGVDYVRTLYAKVNTCPCLLEHGIPGSPDGAPPSLLHQQALDIIGPMAHRRRDAAANTFRTFAHTRRVSTHLETILAAATFGQVEMLFVSEGERIWGAYDPDTGLAALHPEPGPDSDDLLDQAVVQTFLNGGSVQLLEADAMPAASPAAALFYYELEAV